MTLDALLHQIQDSPMATKILEASWIFPWIESFHVLAVTTMVGVIAVVDLRLMGFRAHRRGARKLLAEMLPFAWGAFAIAVVTGGLLFSSQAVDYAANTMFRWKMCVLLAAGLNMAIFQSTAHRRIVEWDEALPPPLAARIAGLLSLSLWVAVIVLGRWIAFAPSNSIFGG